MAKAGFDPSKFTKPELTAQMKAIEDAIKNKTYKPTAPQVSAKRAVGRSVGRKMSKSARGARRIRFTK